MPTIVSYGSFTLDNNRGIKSPFGNLGAYDHSTQTSSETLMKPSKDSVQVRFFIMPRYYCTLEQFIAYHREQGLPIDKSVYLEVISQLLMTFRALHDCKRTYNDLKLANIMVD